MTQHINSFSPTEVAKSVLTALKALLAREPAVVVGGAASILVEAQQALLASHPASWQAAVPVLASFLIRKYVSPAVKPSA